LREDKTAARRRELRLPVRFRAVGTSTDSRVGYTRNVSASGMFIGTRSPLPPSTIVEVQVVRDLDVQIVRAEVVRVVDVTTALRDAVEPSGMGLRFLDPEESSVQTLVGQWNQYATRQLRGRLRR
jgi:hypothetical protein